MVVNNQIKKSLLLSLPVNFFKSVNIWQSYEQEGASLVHFMCLATKLLKDKESARHNPLSCRNYAKYSPILKCGSLSNERVSIWLLTILPHLTHVNTVPGNLSLITALVCDCRSFFDINVSQGSAATL